MRSMRGSGPDRTEPRSSAEKGVTLAGVASTGIGGDLRIFEDLRIGGDLKMHF